MAGQGVFYPVDIVMCIDGTGSMGPVIDQVKAHALKFYGDLKASMGAKDKMVDALRVKVIMFRDLYCDGPDNSMKESAFFKLPEEESSFSAFVNSIQADGGGDEPETGLEALDLAIRSEWTKEGAKRRQVIVIYTDASALQLEKGGKPDYYPQGIARDFNELTDRWVGQEYLSPSAKRLLLFAPDAYPWTDIAASWKNAIHYPSRAGAGLAEHSYTEIIDAIANSV